MKRKARKAVRSQPASNPGPLRIRRFFPAVVALASFIVFYPALSNGFVNWDDGFNYLHNPFFRGLGLVQLKWMFTDLGGHYMPLTWLTLGADYLLWGLNPKGYHLTSMVIHALNAVLCYWVLRSLLQSAWGESTRETLLCSGALAGALFFGIHPQRVESVAWATERRDVVSGLFFFLMMLAYLRAAAPGSQRRGWWLAAATLGFACSLLSKAMVMGAPFVLIALDFYPLRRFKREDRSSVLLEKIPFLVLTAGSIVLTAVAQTHVGAFQVGEYYPLIDRIVQPGYRVCFYLLKTFIPTGLSPLYIFRSSVDGIEPIFYVATFVAISITVGLFLLARRWPAGLVAWLCFGILIGPTIGLMQVGSHFAADRYTYLICLPFAGLIAAGVVKLTELNRAAAMVAAILAASVLGALSWQQTLVWRDSISLWSQALEVDDKNWQAYHYRGRAKEESGDLDSAILDYSQSMRIEPRYSIPLLARGNAYREQGNYDKALADYARALALNPSNADALNNRGLTKASMNEFVDAITDYDTALKLKPDSPSPYLNRGNIRAFRASEYLNRGDAAAFSSEAQAAVDDYTNYIDTTLSQKTRLVDPKYIAMAYLNRGMVKAQQGELDGAIADYNQALYYNPSSADAYANRGQIRMTRGEKTRAAEDFRAALRVAPRDWAYLSQVKELLTGATGVLTH